MSTIFEWLVNGILLATSSFILAIYMRFVQLSTWDRTEWFLGVLMLVVSFGMFFLLLVRLI